MVQMKTRKKKFKIIGKLGLRTDARGFTLVEDNATPQMQIELKKWMNGIEYKIKPLK
jgi:hypothetical protein